MPYCTLYNTYIHVTIGRNAAVVLRVTLSNIQTRPFFIFLLVVVLFSIVIPMLFCEYFAFAKCMHINTDINIILIRSELECVWMNFVQFMCYIYHTVRVHIQRTNLYVNIELLNTKQTQYINIWKYVSWKLIYANSLHVHKFKYIPTFNIKCAKCLRVYTRRP